MKPITIFFLLVLGFSLIFFLLPINIFDGEYIVTSGIQEQVIEAPISLSVFLGIGINPGDLDNIESFRLLPTGYLMAGVFLLGIPGLIAYRIYLSRAKK